MGQYINPVKRCVRPDFCHICISLCNSEFIIEFNREMATKGSIELFSAIIFNPPFFSLGEFHTAACFRWKCGPQTHHWLGMEMYS